MDSLEIVALVLIAVTPLILVLTKGVNTSGVIRSVSYALMSIGALVALGCSHYELLEVGVVVRNLEKMSFTACKWFRRDYGRSV